MLALNVGFILWAVPRHDVGNGRGVLYHGSCDRVHNLSIGLHLVINILSTILLGASNYTMVGVLVILVGDNWFRRVLMVL